MHTASQCVPAYHYSSLIVFLLISIAAAVLLWGPRQINFPSYLMMIICSKCFIKDKVVYIIIKQYLFSITKFTFDNQKQSFQEFGHLGYGICLKGI